MPRGGPSLRERVEAAGRAGHELAALPGEARSAILAALADALADADVRDELLAANAIDLARAREAQARGELAPALVDRLHLSEDKLAGLSDGLRQLACARELVGRVVERRELDEGLLLERVTCPLGTLGVVFEARPDAIPQITGLAIKSGNALVLKGGSEAQASNAALVRVIHGVLARAGVDPACVVLLEDRAEFAALLALDDAIDLVIARGSTAFVELVRRSTTIPVMGHAEGLCHVYLHADAPADMAARICVDAKCSYPAACNSMETLLWHERAGEATRAALEALARAGVELRGCADTRALVPHLALAAATAEDWDSEYSAPVLAVRRVATLADALDHIAAHGSRHTEAIVTLDDAAAARFLAEVDAACVFHNASTRFADGYRFGLGAEVGISTGKLHARGPVGVEGLLTSRWLLHGNGQVTADYGPGKRALVHRERG